MTEKFLQFIWQHQYFNPRELTTTQGETVQIVAPGSLNTNQGPDFNDARIRIGNTLLAGTVELHLKTSHWNLHGHQTDQQYRNVILHVVYEDDERRQNPVLPLLVLKPRIPGSLLKQTEEWFRNPRFIPCENQLPQVAATTWKGWQQQLLEERLQRKQQLIHHFLEQSQQHWEESFWWLLTRQFGNPVNADAFEAIARSLPGKLIARHRNQIHQLEALLLGQAGLLRATFSDAYAKLLKKEYEFLSRKYKLQPVAMPILFLRMRPRNFPTIRLAQLAMLLHGTSTLFSQIRRCDSVKELRELFELTANDYWHYHYRLDEPGNFLPKKLGEDMFHSIVINVISPFLYSYGKYIGQQEYIDKAFQWLEEIAAENNYIIRSFSQLGVKPVTAAETQSLLELKTHYCDQQRCLDCAIGHALLQPPVPQKQETR